MSRALSAPRRWLIASISRAKTSSNVRVLLAAAPPSGAIATSHFRAACEWRVITVTT